MRRARHIELGLFSWEEAKTALSTAFMENPGLSIADDLMEGLVRSSYGHPYMIQLLGYYLIVLLNEVGAKDAHVLTGEEVDRSTSMAQTAFESRALGPLVAELSPSERGYLRALAQVLDEQREGSTAEVASQLGKVPSKVAYLRESLINNGIIIASGHGKVMFNVPYLASYMLKEETQDSAVQRAKMWRI